MDRVDREPVRLITVSREYGAGGSELGGVLGERLGWPVLDRELARRIAARLRCEDRIVELLAERAPTLLERVAAAFTVVPAEAPILPDAAGPVDPDHLVEATQAVLREAARALPLIVIGHGANCVFRQRADVLRVRVTAPFDLRVRRVAARTGAATADAEADVRRHDANRRHYLDRYYRCDMNDPCAYDLQMNTGTMSLETAATVVSDIVTARQRD
jgi:hypothetical protein